MNTHAKDDTLNVAIELPVDETWRAGTNYLEALFYALLRA